jgi:hypothetical protein
MKEVNPLDLIPGEIYYLEDTFVGLAKRRGCSHRGIGEFVKNEIEENSIFATFKNVKSVNDKPFASCKTRETSNIVVGTSLPTDIFTFYVGPNKSSYKIYKNYRYNIDRANKKAQLTAFEKMLNKQKLPKNKISPSTLFDENPVDPTFYESDDNKTDIGTQLTKEYASYLSSKKSAGKSPCKTCKQSSRTKSSRTKSSRTKSSRTKSSRTKSSRTKSRRRQ